MTSSTIDPMLLTSALWPGESSRRFPGALVAAPGVCPRLEGSRRRSCGIERRGCRPIHIGHVRRARRAAGKNIVEATAINPVARYFESITGLQDYESNVLGLCGGTRIRRRGLGCQRRRDLFSVGGL